MYTSKQLTKRSIEDRIETITNEIRATQASIKRLELMIKYNEYKLKRLQQDKAK